MQRVIVFLLVLIATPAVAETSSFSYFPPADCSPSELRVMAWKTGDSTTRCLAPQQLLKLALPGCSAGQIVVFDGNGFACKDPSGNAAKVTK